MAVLTTLLYLVHILVCLFLIVVVLLQSGKAADLAGAFGGMGSQTAFGPRGSATLLSKATTVAACIFMATSLTLAILATRGTGAGTTVLERQPAKPAPATPLPGAPSGQPSVTLFNEQGQPVQTVPLPLPPQGQPQPQAPAPAKK
ncbi:MAG: preprotein translocase subunit SecG [Bryobacterales bacterium]|nr:preprotein translocase subunit SecG [Bryobacteraceae bacterium]MDW8130677.1 preprotein translocase subunit SecG [Bryobacterales bacterium]